MTETMGYKRWNVAFFAVFLILFVIPCIQFELEGIMTGTTRILLGAMIALLVYGLIRSIIRLNASGKNAKKGIERPKMLKEPYITA